MKRCLTTGGACATNRKRGRASRATRPATCSSINSRHLAHAVGEPGKLHELVQILCKGVLLKYQTREGNLHRSGTRDVAAQETCKAADRAGRRNRWQLMRACGCPRRPLRQLARRQRFAPASAEVERGGDELSGAHVDVALLAGNVTAIDDDAVANRSSGEVETVVGLEVLHPEWDQNGPKGGGQRAARKFVVGALVTVPPFAWTLHVSALGAKMGSHLRQLRKRTRTSPHQVWPTVAAASGDPVLAPSASALAGADEILVEVGGHCGVAVDCDDVVRR
mmetsp:Transcript_50615/g.130759  ORF Transcript_50615/g.130759 Transcript_50615/m.130759 type:complete len:279 (-) Transcript_50615:158-994(-)